jgi:gluconokinase
MSGPIVVMGVAGSGKSTVGAALAERRGCPFVDGDDHHPEANVAKMTAGIPLDDGDRVPWLATLNRLLRDRQAEGHDVVLACSALRDTYRRRLGDGVDGLVFVHLVIDEAEARRRLRERPGHYMAEAMVAGQFTTLEEPARGEAVRVEATAPVDEIVDRVLSRLGP